MANQDGPYLNSQGKIRKGKHFQTNEVGSGIFLQRNQSEA